MASAPASPTDLLACYSPDYFVARDRFRQAAKATGATLHALPIAAEGPDRERLWIDAAVFGPATAPACLVVTSGLHGVEGFFGSAVIQAWLACFAEQVPVGLRVVLIHAANPYGYAWLRRWNEENVDLNRNFPIEGETYTQGPNLYARLHSALNPRRPPARWDAWPLMFTLLATRYGVRAVTQAIPAGQYEFPQGLFFGGYEPSESVALLTRRLPEWIGPCPQVVHFDLHTGLGGRGEIGLFFHFCADDPAAVWFEPFRDLARLYFPRLTATSKLATLYLSRGSFDVWCKHHFPERRYLFATLEAGTWTPARILRALRAENQAFHYAKGNAQYDWARRDLVEAFFPADPAWRTATLDRSARLLLAATERLRAQTS